MKIAVLGTGMVGQALAARLSGLGHEVTVGTRDPERTLDRTDPDGMGNPPFSAWASSHPQVPVATYADAAAQAELVVNATSGPGAVPAAVAAAGAAAGFAAGGAAETDAAADAGTGLLLVSFMRV